MSSKGSASNAARLFERIGAYDLLLQQAEGCCRRARRAERELEKLRKAVKAMDHAKSCHWILGQFDRKCSCWKSKLAPDLEDLESSP